jgi:UDP-glucose 4-epimerase
VKLDGHYKGRKVLVTGGLGFIGSNLAIELVRLGADVTVLDCLIPEHGGNRFNIAEIEDQVSVNISDMRDANSLNVLVGGMDDVFHLAGQVSHGDSMRDPQLDLGVNCISTINLVEACRHHAPDAVLVYSSTRQVYGRPETLPVREDHPTVPVDVNGINKLAAEYYHRLYDRTYGLRSVVLRLTNTYGPRQQIRSDRQGFIGIFIRQALRGERLRLFGTGEQRRDFNYVDDVTDALLRAAALESCHGKTFNLGAPRNYSLLQFVSALAEHTQVEFELVPFPDDKKIIDIGDYYGDWSAFADASGWAPVVDLDEGIQRTVEHYLAHPDVYWR